MRRPFGPIAPAAVWRAFLLAALAAGGGAARLTAAAPPVKPPELAQVGKPDAAQAAAILEQFRAAGIPGDYFLRFELRALPRRGEERVFQGRLWASRNAAGAITRVELADADGRAHRLLIQNGAQPAVWRYADGAVAPLTGAALVAPLIAGTEVSAFDVQMPFLHWPDAMLEKISRVRGRPTHAFLFKAPPAFAAGQPGIAAARAYLDTQYNALLQTELLGPDGRIVKTFSLLGLKTVGRQPLPKTADYRNEVTRDKTRLAVTGAALDLELPAAVFDPDQLAREAPEPAAIVPLDE